MSRAFIGTQDNNVFVNSTIYNETDNPINCEYDTTFTSPLLEDSGEFYLTIVRFDIPNTLPIFTFQTNTYYLTLSYNGSDYTVPLIMYNVDINKPTSLKIYTFQQFVDMINVAFQTAFSNMKAAFPGAPPTEAPYMVFNHDRDFVFSLFVQQSYNPTVGNLTLLEPAFSQARKNRVGAIAPNINSNKRQRKRR